MEIWTPDEFQIPESLTDYTVSTRHNQVTRPIKYIAWIEKDEGMLADIEMFVRASYHQSILDRSMGLDARVLDALVGILEDEKYARFRMEGELNGFGQCVYALTRDIAKVANEIMDDMNIGETSDEDSDDQKKRRKGMTTKTAAEICRTTHMLQAYRTMKGYVIVFDPDKIEVAKIRYGLTDTLKDLPDSRSASVEKSEGLKGDQLELLT